MKDILKNFAKVNLCHQPTPLEEMPRLTEALAGPRLFVKRDDCTGLASGGNKTRKLEFLIADALSLGADTLVTYGAVQSNHVRQTAAAACKIGLNCHVILERRVLHKGQRYEETSNILLNYMFGATIEFREAGLDITAEALALTNSLKSQGKNPYFIPGGGSNEIGSLGYVSCAQELLLQIKNQRLNVQSVIVATGSFGTQAGLTAGFSALGCDIPIIGISVRRKREEQIDNVYKLSLETSKLLGAKPIKRNQVLVYDNYIGEGYAIPNKGTMDAIEILAKKEGILLDPVYTGKAMAGLIDLIDTEVINATGDVVFIHTGGSVALFAYEDELRPKIL